MSLLKKIVNGFRNKVVIRNKEGDFLGESVYVDGSVEVTSPVPNVMGLVLSSHSYHETRVVINCEEIDFSSPFNKQPPEFQWNHLKNKTVYLEIISGDYSNTVCGHLASYTSKMNKNGSLNTSWSFSGRVIPESQVPYKINGLQKALEFFSSLVKKENK